MKEYVEYVNDCLEFSVAVGCSFNCSYCPQTIHKEEYAKRSNETMMTFGVFKKCLDKSPTHIDVHFVGMAEPWLNPNINDMLHYTNKRGHKIQIYTTLEKVSMEDLYIIKDIPFDVFGVHILNKNKTKPPRHIIEKINFIKHEIKPKKINMMSVDSKVINEELKGFIKDKSNSVVKNENIGSLSRAGLLEETSFKKTIFREGKLKCQKSKRIRRTVVMPNGDALLCNVDYGQKHVIGNLVENEYEDLYKSDEYLKVKKGLYDENIDTLCRTCENSRLMLDWEEDNIPRNKKVLVVCSHHDDETIFCGGTILKFTKNNNIVDLIVVVDVNEEKDNRGQLKKQEFDKAVKALGINKVIELNKKNVRKKNSEEFKNQKQELINDLKDYKYQYDYVFTHGWEGEYGHAHHKLVHQSVKNVFPIYYSFSLYERNISVTIDNKSKKEILAFYDDDDLHQWIKKKNLIGEFEYFEPPNFYYDLYKED